MRLNKSFPVILLFVLLAVLLTVMGVAAAVFTAKHHNVKKHQNFKTANDGSSNKEETAPRDLPCDQHEQTEEAVC